MALNPPRSCFARSKVIMTEHVLPSHTNALGTIFGGVIMGWIDIAGAIAAQRYSRSHVVTVSVDYLHFIVPIKIGFVVGIEACVTYVGKTSMEIEVIVTAENPITAETKRATQAFLTYVAVDENGRPKPVPPCKPRTTDDLERIKQAEKRRQLRLKWFRES